MLRQKGHKFEFSLDNINSMRPHINNKVQCKTLVFNPQYWKNQNIPPGIKKKKSNAIKYLNFWKQSLLIFPIQKWIYCLPFNHVTICGPLEYSLISVGPTSCHLNIKDLASLVQKPKICSILRINMIPPMLGYSQNASALRMPSMAIYVFFYFTINMFYFFPIFC